MKKMNQNNSGGKAILGRVVMNGLTVILISEIL